MLSMNKKWLHILNVHTVLMQFNHRIAQIFSHLRCVYRNEKNRTYRSMGGRHSCRFLFDIILQYHWISACIFKNEAHLQRKAALAVIYRREFSLYYAVCLLNFFFVLLHCPSTFCWLFLFWSCFFFILFIFRYIVATFYSEFLINRVRITNTTTVQ